MHYTKDELYKNRDKIVNSKVKVNLELTYNEIDTIRRALFYQNIDLNGWGASDKQHEYLISLFQNMLPTNYKYIR